MLKSKGMNIYVERENKTLSASVREKLNRRIHVSYTRVRHFVIGEMIFKLKSVVQITYCHVVSMCVFGGDAVHMEQHRCGFHWGDFFHHNFDGRFFIFCRSTLSFAAQLIRGAHASIRLLKSVAAATIIYADVAFSNF